MHKPDEPWPITNPVSAYIYQDHLVLITETRTLEGGSLGLELRKKGPAVDPDSPQKSRRLYFLPPGEHAQKLHATSQLHLVGNERTGQLSQVS